MAPDARMNDGRLDLVTRQRSGPGIFLRAFYATTRARRPPRTFSCYRQGQQFTFASEAPMTVQMDGDPLPALKWMEIAIAPGRLRLITPT